MKICGMFALLSLLLSSNFLFASSASKSNLMYNSKKESTLFIKSQRSFETSEEEWAQFLEANRIEYSEHFAKQNIPQEAFLHVLDYFTYNMNRFSNKKEILFNDFTKVANEERSFLLNLVTGSAEENFVSHGTNSDLFIIKGKTKKRNGIVDRTSNKIDSKMTSRGLMVTGNFYLSNKGFPVFKVDNRTVNAVRLHGLEKGKNDNVYSRGVVIHEKRSYESCYNVKDPSKVPLTHGCPGFPKEVGRAVMKVVAEKSLDEAKSYKINQLTPEKRYGGTLVYNYTNEEKSVFKNIIIEIANLKKETEQEKTENSKVTNSNSR